MAKKNPLSARPKGARNMAEGGPAEEKMDREYGQKKPSKARKVMNKKIFGKGY
jgi:hypothetical protein